MIINGQALLEAEPITDMLRTKEKAHGVSYGLSEVGYDIRLKQRVRWIPPNPVLAMDLYTNRRKAPNTFYTNFFKAFHGFTEVLHTDYKESTIRIGRCLLASTIEAFDIPTGLWCEFRNKSTHARCFVDASLGTDGEPGWKGNLTVEIVFHDLEPIEIPAGSGIMKAVFHEIKNKAQYPEDGKYQNQPDMPVPAIKE
jgi:dCTP deaminase